MLLVAALALLLGTSPAPASSAYVVDRWDVEAGLPNNAVTDLIQTRDGYLWIATWAGIVRFDGVRFTPVAEDLPNDHAVALLEDRDGTIWIGLSGTGLVRWRGRVLETLTSADGLAGRDIRALAEDEDGRIWAGTENGLSAIEPRPFDGARDALAAGTSRITTYRRANGLPDNAIRDLARGRDGRMWIATSKGICEARHQVVRCDRRGFQGAPTAVLEDPRGRLWIGTDAGVFSEHVAGPAMPRRPVHTMRASSDGAIWVGFVTGGVARIGDGGVKLYGAAEGLPWSGVVRAIHEDAEGNVWAGIDNGGLARFKRTRVRIYSTEEGLPSNVIGSIVQDAAGQIWAAAQCGPVSALVDDRFVPRFAAYTKEACARVIWPARDGSLWIGTKTSGLFHWSGGRMEQFTPSTGLSDANVTALFEDQSGVMWIGTEVGDVHTYANGRLSRGFGKTDGVATGFVSSFAQQRDGRIWIGSNANGLTVFEGGLFRTLAPDERPPTPNISALLVDSRGDLWIGSAANGLFRRRNGRYEPFGLAQGLGDRLIAVVVEDRDANLWVGTARGISRLERQMIEAVADGRAASLQPIILDRADGLLNPEGSGGGLDPSGLRDRDGRVWMSTIGGIAVIDPAAFRINKILPRVLIEGTTVENRPARSEDGVIVVPAGAESIEVAYTAFSFLSPAKVRFQYRLDGFDTQWHDAGARRTAYYGRLPPGSYRFQVLASNNDGLWSTHPAVVALTVLPFWWERWPVRAAALAFLLVATGISVRYAVVKRSRERLAELERERMLERERTRIARDLHDELGSSLSLIGLMAEGSDASIEARRAAETLDQLVWTVNAQNDTVGSFAAYATRLAEEHLDAAGVRHRFHIAPGLGDRALAADVRRQIYLAFKEAIHNVVKHARAKEVHVSMQIEGDTLVVAVADDGCGFVAGSGDPTGIGATAMRERLATIGGSFSLTSAPGHGTRVVFRCPLTSHPKADSHAHAILRRLRHG